MIISPNFYGCAATYLYNFPKQKVNESIKKDWKVEAICPSNTGKRFNCYAGEKANFSSHIDVCI